MIAQQGFENLSYADRPLPDRQGSDRQRRRILISSSSSSRI